MVLVERIYRLKEERIHGDLRKALQRKEITMDPAPYGTLKGRITQELFALISPFLKHYFHDQAKHCGSIRRNQNGATPKMSDIEVFTVVLVGELK